MDRSNWMSSVAGSQNAGTIREIITCFIIATIVCFAGKGPNNSRHVNAYLVGVREA